jgi:hypothetical protein
MRRARSLELSFDFPHIAALPFSLFSRAPPHVVRGRPIRHLSEV